MTSILNLARLQRKLDRLPKATTTLVRAAMEKEANIIVEMMKSLVAVDNGDLRDSIGWTWGKRPAYSQVVATVKGSLGGGLTITIYVGNDKVRYAHLVEWGAAPHIAGGKFAGAQHPGATAQPFFFVSWRANRKGSSRAIRAAMRQAAKQVAAGS